MHERLDGENPVAAAERRRGVVDDLLLWRGLCACRRQCSGDERERRVELHFVTPNVNTVLDRKRSPGLRMVDGKPA